MDKLEMRTKIVDIVKDYAEGNYHLDITEENLKIAAEEIVKLFAIPVVSVSVLCAAPENIKPCRHEFSGICQYNGHCNFKTER